MAKATATKDSAFKKFFKENKSLAFMLPLLVILIVVVIIVYAGGGETENAPVVKQTNPTPSQTANTVIPQDQPKVEVLPQVERSSEIGSEVEPIKDPFEAPMKLTGILQYSNGDATAIIESGGVSYIVKVEDFIGDSTWKVLSIYESSVMLDSNGKSMLLELNKSMPAPSNP